MMPLPKRSSLLLPPTIAPTRSTEKRPSPRATSASQTPPPRHPLSTLTMAPQTSSGSSPRSPTSLPHPPSQLHLRHRRPDRHLPLLPITRKNNHTKRK